MLSGITDKKSKVFNLFKTNYFKSGFLLRENEVYSAMNHDAYHFGSPLISWRQAVFNQHSLALWCSNCSRVFADTVLNTIFKDSLSKYIPDCNVCKTSLNYETKDTHISN